MVRRRVGPVISRPLVNRSSGPPRVRRVLHGVNLGRAWSESDGSLAAALLRGAAMLARLRVPVRGRAAPRTAAPAKLEHRNFELQMSGETKQSRERKKKDRLTAAACGDRPLGPPVSRQGSGHGGGGLGRARRRDRDLRFAVVVFLGRSLPSGRHRPSRLLHHFFLVACHGSRRRRAWRS